MPVIFTEEQREEIKQQIRENAIKCFEKKGVRKTTVAELADSVGIAKGTFYNFYQSGLKEEFPLYYHSIYESLSSHIHL